VTSSSPASGSPPAAGPRCFELAFALDYPTLSLAEAGAQAVAPFVRVLKVGLELFVKAGPPAVEMARATGADVFLDLKLHDIEKTVERAVGVSSQLGVRYLTVHTSGGPGMLEAAARRAQKEDAGLTILGVTVLTSLDEGDLAAVGVPSPAQQQVLRLARLARDSGLGGLVCSAQEVSAVRSTVGHELELVTPGIRPLGADAGDQKRVASPEQAIFAGSNLLVVGRPIRDAEDPAAAAAAIGAEVQGAVGRKGA
jgi:orotidine-5'-phosphate decarboxylase